MYFDTIEAAPLMTNCYLIGDEKAKACAVVDPGGSPEKVIAMIERSNMEIKMILLTHGHYDHIGAVDALLEKWPGLPVYIHPADLCPAESTRERYRMPDKGASQRTYGDGDVLELGELRIHVLHTPGHSPGSVSLLVGDTLFSGDTLFCSSMGRTDLPGGSYEQIMASLKKLGQLKGNLKVLPGHEWASTLDREREYNYFLKEAMASGGAAK